MTSLPATKQFVGVDLIRDSIELVVAILFPKSRSAGYAASLNLALQAEKYGEAEIGGTLFHYAAFGRSREQVALALAVARYLDGVKAVQFYAGGKMILERLRVESVLTCYLEAGACNDHLAHCNKVVTNPFGGAISNDDRGSPGGYLFPCSFLLQWGNPSLQRQHPSSLKNQIQAMAVRNGCDWCPNFIPADFKKL
jgi:hypothetical protein